MLKSLLKKLKKSKKILAIFIFFFTAIIISVFFYIFLKDLPSPAKLASYDIPQTTKIYDRKGQLLFDIFAEQNRTVVNLEDIPDYLIKATISIEDKDFYKHQGINPVGGLLRAVKETVTKGKLQGGSTITQQLIKTALLTPERTLQRKIKEMILATWAEIIYSKEEILEMYLNHVAYGGTYYGIASAAQGYFGKNVSQLTLGESALLAGLPAAPTFYSPFGARPEEAKKRQLEVLRRMVEDGYISQEQATLAKEEELVFLKQRTDIEAPHFVMYVKEQLVEKYGERMVEQGGLKVTTTLDLDLQKIAEATVASHVDRLKFARVSNGAVLITRPPTGEILAMVGSKDYFATDSGNFNVTTSLRQPGSAIKPINYAIGLETKKITLSSLFLDVPTCFRVANQPLYCPRNYDGTFHGAVQLRFALGNSYNIPAVKMLAINEVETMVASSSAFGITSFTDSSRYGLSLTLGGGEVRMTEMATAFAVLANMGIKKELVSILKVEDHFGKLLEEFTDDNFSLELNNLKAPSYLLIDGPRVLSAEAAFLISHILLDNNARQAAFGTNSVLRIPTHQAVSVKTGTTDDFKDNWTIGFTPNFLTAVWVGNNDNTPMRTSGAEGAAPIWNGIMRQVLRNQPDIFPKQPAGIVGRHVCSITGTLPPTDENDNPLSAEQGGCETRFEYFQEDNFPAVGLGIRIEPVAIDTTTGRLAKEGQTENIEIREQQIISDPLTPIYCLDCPSEGQEPILVSL